MKKETSGKTPRNGQKGSQGQGGRGGIIIAHDPDRCRVAYTLNNWQPVICTIISDQPLFYMNEMRIEDDQEGLAHLDLLLEEGLRPLAPALSEQEQLDRLTRVTDALCGTNNSALKEPGQNSEYLCAALEKTVLGRSYRDFLTEQGIRIVPITGMDRVSYCRQDRIIRVPDHLDHGACLLQGFAEIRRAWQHRMGTLVDPMAFHPDHAILINRIQHADRALTAVRLAWDMNLSGDDAPWTMVMHGHLSDVAGVLARAARDFRALSNGRAFMAAFEAWFLSERCRKLDRTLIQRMLADYKNYTQCGVASASLAAATDLIARIGEQPMGKNYLAGHVSTVLRDSVFAEVRDRSNANFLWFIKFEQSFLEAEHSLQAKEQAGAPVPAGLVRGEIAPPASGEVLTHPRFIRPSFENQGLPYADHATPGGRDPLL